MLAHMNGWARYELRDLDDAEKRAEVCGVAVSAIRPGVKGIVLAESLEKSRAHAEKVLKNGPWPKFYFTKGGKGGVRRKTYLDKVGGIPPTNLWEYEDVGHTDEAKKELMTIFGGKSPFDTPKPVRLLERVLSIVGKKDALVLDSFAGSGTTAHAVLKMNAADGGNRRFILVEMMDYAESITAERAKRVIQGYGPDDKAVDGTGGAFGYYELGPALMNGDVLNEALPVDRIREYVWFSETKRPLPEGKLGDPYLLGVKDGTAYYFCYEKDRATNLDRPLLRRLKTKAESYVVFADTCLLGEDALRRYRITFKKIPRDITRL